MRRRAGWVGPLALATAMACDGAHAQLAVIDAASISQLVQQATTLTQQLSVLQAQLAQAQMLYASTTGTRNMQQVLNPGTPNYLPTSWPELLATLQGTDASYAALSGAFAAAMGANAVLTSTQLSVLSPGAQAAMAADRQAVALLQGLTQQALLNSSTRFGQIQQLLATIGSTSDQKGVLELQATLTANQGLLQNEQTKLQILYQTAQSEQWADQQRERESMIAAHGQFSTRFEPTPP